MAKTEFRFAWREVDLRRKWSRMKPRALEAMVQYMLREIHGFFREQRDPDGVPWAKHSPVTQGRLYGQWLGGLVERDDSRVTGRDRRGRAVNRALEMNEREKRKYTRILYRMGDLFRSIVTTKVWRLSVIMASNLPYAWVHNEGAVIKTTKRQRWWMHFNLFGRMSAPWKGRPSKITYPRRTFLGFGRRQMAELQRIGEWWMYRVMKDDLFGGGR